MTKKEAIRQTQQENVLMALGFTSQEAESLRRISMTLHRWHERECGDDGGCIERDETTGKTYWLSAMSGKRYATPDRETGAKKRLKAIVSRVNVQRAGKVGKLYAYIQCDPRGAALYILRPGDIPEGQSADACYSRGICVY